MILNEEYFMKQALQQAKIASNLGEIPVGAVVVVNQQIIGKGYNQTEKLKDVTAHAEILAITAAALFLNSKYLKDATLYVTLEPCVMCAGASYWAQIGKIVYGANDEKRGGVRKKLTHPKTKIISGVLEKECRILLKEFFVEKR